MVIVETQTHARSGYCFDCLMASTAEAISSVVCWYLSVAGVHLLRAVLTALAVVLCT